MAKFDIFAKLQEEIDDFDTGGVYIVGKPGKQGDNVSKDFSKQAEKGGYYYSQKEILTAIDLASASKYKKGIRDEEGQRKTYLNIVNFYRDVAKMKTQIRASSYKFDPWSDDYAWPVWLMDRKFKQYAQNESYDDLIAEFNHDYNTYGTTVGKRLKDCTERVPLRTLRCTQTAKSLLHACMNGGYALIESDIHYNSMKDYPSWKTDGLSKNKSFVCYERYALVPKKLFDKWASTASDGSIDDYDENEEMIFVQAILCPEAKSLGERKGKILFMEKLTEKTFPLEECHAEKVDGRWLGKGEIEKQLENQISRNLTANLRRRGLLWGVKKIYQSDDDEVQKNLVMEAKDGDVIKVKKNSLITQVNTASQHTGDFQNDDEAVKENSQQIAFAFSVATGEDMPSGTPFSLSVVLSKAVESHFTGLRNTFSNFLRRSFFDQLIPIFQKEYADEHTMSFSISLTDIENLKESITAWHVNDRVWSAWLSRKKPDAALIRSQVEQEMAKNGYLFVHMPENFYPDAGYYMNLIIDEDTGPDITSLTSLYQALSVKGDPRADQVLKMIFAKQGKNLDAIAGGAPKGTPQQANPTVDAQGKPIAAKPVTPVATGQ